MAESDIPIKRGLPELGVRRPWLVLVLNLLVAIGGIAADLGAVARLGPNYTACALRAALFFEEVGADQFT